MTNIVSATRIRTTPRSESRFGLLLLRRWRLISLETDRSLAGAADGSRQVNDGVERLVAVGHRNLNRLIDSVAAGIVHADHDVRIGKSGGACDAVDGGLEIDRVARRTGSVGR